MPTIAVLGAQWGDEGKGKIVHFLAQDADMSVRFNGGTNAGHTVVEQDNKFQMHLIPSGALQPGCVGVLGNGMVIDPFALTQEMEEIKKAAVTPKIFISKDAHLILPYHPIVEKLAGATNEIGTTGRGIGPTYRDKASRTGIKVIDLLNPDLLKSKIDKKVNSEKELWGTNNDLAKIETEDLTNKLLSTTQDLTSQIVDTSKLINQAIYDGKTVVFEGAQGCLLDIDFGTYPFVTSSTTTIGGIGSGAGVSPRKIEKVVGVVKAYTTRVGSGPFPTEERGEIGERLREKGQEYGTTTGRPRRCGWLDLLALKYACRINGFSGLAVTKLDVLSGLSEIKIATGYKYKNELLEDFPSSSSILDNCTPEYASFKGWEEDITHCKNIDELPKNARTYLKFLTDELNTPLSIISVGPEFANTIIVS